MAKKQITTYKFVPGNTTPSTNLYANTFELVDMSPVAVIALFTVT